ncbi:hypothetical protein [Synechococcus sp. MIT S9507]|uniref:hypothetical protein n=1 Tax=Synechococcus sp. MIT S9507 TaxID=3082544 RepID=UPI0039B406DB
MPASLAKQRETAEKCSLIWRMFLAGFSQQEIADKVNLSVSRISKVIKKMAAKHPITNMSIEERSAAGFELCMEAHRQTSEFLNEARELGLRHELPRLLALKSLSASRIARVLQGLPEVVQQSSEVTFNLQAFQQLTGSGGQQQLEPSAAEPITVEAS